MMTRCYNTKRDTYKYYGGKGVAVCRRWMKFENFYADMGPRPKGTSLDRKNGEKGYSKQNCRWATRAQQSQNRPKKPVTRHYRDAILALVSVIPTTTLELSSALALHPEVVKQEIRALRKSGIVKTTLVPWGKQARTLLCEFNGRH